MVQRPQVSRLSDCVVGIFSRRVGQQGFQSIKAQVRSTPVTTDSTQQVLSGCSVPAAMDALADAAEPSVQIATSPRRCLSEATLSRGRFHAWLALFVTRAQVRSRFDSVSGLTVS